MVEDGSRIHFKQSILEFKNRLGLVNLPHPPFSPDLNPIENMWGIIKMQLARRERQPQSQDELWQWIQEEWEAILLEAVNKAIDNMETHRKLLQQNKGLSIPY